MRIYCSDQDLIFIKKGQFLIKRNLTHIYEERNCWKFRSRKEKDFDSNPLILVMKKVIRVTNSRKIWNPLPFHFKNKMKEMKWKRSTYNFYHNKESQDHKLPILHLIMIIQNQNPKNLETTIKIQTFHQNNTNSEGKKRQKGLTTIPWCPW